jgi:tetratricopeptide (TPR) repeat protein
LGQRSQSDPEIIRKAIELYLTPKKYDLAVEILKTMLKGAPQSSELHYLLAVAYRELEQPDSALEHFLAVRPDSNFYQNAAFQIAFIYQQKGNLQDAIDMFKKVIAVSPDNSELYLYMGSFYEENGDFQNAEATLKSGIKLDPENSDLLFRLGVVYDKWGRKADCIETMKAVIRLDSENANALNYLGYTYADQGQNLDEAERLILEALKFRPNDGYIIDSLGWVYYRKGLYSKSLDTLKDAVQRIPDDPVILEHLAEVYLKLNNPQKALELYKRSLMNAEKEKVENIRKKIQELIDQGVSEP